MKRNYQQPFISVEEVKVETGFATSDAGWGLDTPGGEIDYDDYKGEL